MQARPTEALHSLSAYGQLADTIWRAAGDTSTDFNWYTKRALVVGVYIATELFMLTDRSEGWGETWASLERRVDDAMRLGRNAGQMGAAAAEVLGGAGPGRARGGGA